MQTVTVPRAVALLLTANASSDVHDRGYTLLRNRCAAYLADNFTELQNSPQAQRVLGNSRSRTVLEAEMRRHMRHVLAHGNADSLGRMEALLQHQIRQRCMTRSQFETPWVFHWLCTRASCDTWHALHEHDIPVQPLIVRQRAAAFRHAARSGRADLLAMMWNYTSPRQRDLLWTACEYGALRFAAAKGDVNAFDVLMTAIDDASRREIASEPLIWVAAASSASVALLQRLLLLQPHCVTGQLAALRTLVNADNVYGIHALLVSNPHAVQLLTEDNAGVFRAACINGAPYAIGALLGFVQGNAAALQFVLTQGYLAAITHAQQPDILARTLMLLAQAAQHCGLQLHPKPFHDALLLACKHNHAFFIANVLNAMDETAQRHCLLEENHSTPDYPNVSLMAAACAHGSEDTIRFLLERATALGITAAVLLANHGGALAAATERGDTRILGQLIAALSVQPRALSALTKGNAAYHIMRRAMLSNHKETLTLWLSMMPDREAEFLEHGDLVVTALEANAAETLDVIFAAAQRHGLTAALMRQATSPPAGEDNHEATDPLQRALRLGHGAAVDALLRHAPAGMRTRQFAERFTDLCRTDLAYFTKQWDGFGRYQQEELLTTHRLAHLPTFASPQVAVFLMNAAAGDRYAAALRTLPENIGLSSTAAAAVVAMILAAQPPLRDGLWDVYGAALLDTAIEYCDTDLWHFVVAELERTEILDILANDNAELFRAAMAWPSQVRQRILEFVILSDAWVRDPQAYPMLARAALNAVVEDDNVTLLRELFAKHPRARQNPQVARVLRTGDALWTAHAPRVAAFVTQGPIS